MRFRRLVLVLWVSAPMFAQAVVVPFVGCESSGQTEVSAAPKGTARRVAISAYEAGTLAYFRSADGIGVLGPRGWYCEGAWGSGGGVLYLGPTPVRNDGSGWGGLDGPVIEVNHMTSENSGRYDVAVITARVFPQYRASAARVLKLMDCPLPAGPYPVDNVVRKTGNVVEYRTPAQTEGLGNADSWIGRNDLPIRGVVMLVRGADGPDALLLSVRFPVDLAGLAPAIIRQFERDNSHSTVKGK